MSDGKQNDGRGGLGDRVYDRYATDPGVVQTTSGFGLGERMSNFAVARTGLMREIQGRWAPENAPRQTMPAIDRVWSESPFASVSRSARYGSISPSPAALPLPAVLQPASSVPSAMPANAALPQERGVGQPAGVSVEAPVIYTSPQPGITSGAPFADISAARAVAGSEPRLARAALQHVEAEASSKPGLRDEEQTGASEAATASSGSAVGSVIEAPHSAWQSSEHVLKDLSRPQVAQHPPPAQVTRHEFEHAEPAMHLSAAGGRVEADPQLAPSLPIHRAAVETGAEASSGHGSHDVERAHASEEATPNSGPVIEAARSAWQSPEPVLGDLSRAEMVQRTSSSAQSTSRDAKYPKSGEQNPTASGRVEASAGHIAPSLPIHRALETSAAAESGASAEPRAAIVTGASADKEARALGATPTHSGITRIANSVTAVMQRPILSRSAREAAQLHLKPKHGSLALPDAGGQSPAPTSATILRAQPSLEATVPVSRTPTLQTEAGTAPTGEIESGSVGVNRAAEAPLVLRTPMQEATVSTTGDANIQENKRNALSSVDPARASDPAGATSVADPIYRSPDTIHSALPPASIAADMLASPAQTAGASRDRKDGATTVTSGAERTLPSDPVHRAAPVVMRSSSTVPGIASSSSEDRNSSQHAQTPTPPLAQRAGASGSADAPLVLAPRRLDGSLASGAIKGSSSTEPQVHALRPLAAPGPSSPASGEAMSVDSAASYDGANSSTAPAPVPSPAAAGSAVAATHRSPAAMPTGSLRPMPPDAKVVVPVHRSASALTGAGVRPPLTASGLSGVHHADVRPVVHSTHQELVPEPGRVTQLSLEPAAAPPSRTFLQRTAAASVARAPSLDQANSSPRPPAPSAPTSPSSPLPDANVTQIANRVYDLLVRRLANERQRRGA